MNIRESTRADFEAILLIINEAADAYQDVIPADCWNDPYMPARELENEISSGVRFWIVVENKRICGVMGIQDKGEIALIRHAYTLPADQRKGVGTMLLHHLESLTGKPFFVGTWADASWAITFYQRNGYQVVSVSEKDRLLRKYWTIPERQIETSVVLAKGFK